MTDQTVERPGGVQFVVLLAWLAAMTDIVAGGIFLLLSFGRDIVNSIDIDEDILRYYSLALLLAGAFTAFVAYYLGKGNRGARVFTIVVMALRLLNAVWALTLFENVTLWIAVLDAAFSILIIVLLSKKSASAFYAKRD